jgi:hypothetical protein
MSRSQNYIDIKSLIPTSNYFSFFEPNENILKGRMIELSALKKIIPVNFEKEELWEEISKKISLDQPTYVNFLIDAQSFVGLVLTIYKYQEKIICDYLLITHNYRTKTNWPISLIGKSLMTIGIMTKLVSHFFKISFVNMFMPIAVVGIGTLIICSPCLYEQNSSNVNLKNIDINLAKAYLLQRFFEEGHLYDNDNNLVLSDDKKVIYIDEN